jgi:hypothetical protein
VCIDRTAFTFSKSSYCAWGPPPGAHVIIMYGAGPHPGARIIIKLEAHTKGRPLGLVHPDNFIIYKFNDNPCMFEQSSN